MRDKWRNALFVPFLSKLELELEFEEVGFEEEGLEEKLIGELEGTLPFTVHDGAESGGRRVRVLMLVRLGGIL